MTRRRMAMTTSKMTFDELIPFVTIETKVARVYQLFMFSPYSPSKSLISLS